VQGRIGVTPFYFFAKIQGVIAAVILIIGLFLSSPMGREFFHQRESLEKD